MKILTKHGFEEFGFIHRSDTPQPILMVTCSDGSTLKLTPDHEVEVNEEFVAAKDLLPGDIFSDGTAVMSICDSESEYVYDVVNVAGGNQWLANNKNIKNCIYLDEFAHIDNDVEFYTSTYPVISSGKSTQVIMTSTPKGLNLFYKLWTDAVEGRNGFKTLAYDWSVVPGRDEAWRDETINNTSPVQFSQEFECVDGDTIVTVLDTLTGMEKDIKISDLHDCTNNV